MTARFAVFMACLAVASGGLLTACASGDSSTGQENEGGSGDSTTPDGAGAESQGGGGETGTGMDGARGDAGADADATVPGDAMADSATATDSTVLDTGAADATVDTGAVDAPADAGADADTGAADSGESDAKADGNADGQSSGDAEAGAQDAAADRETDTGADTGSDARADAAADAANDAGPDTGVGQGPVCQHPDGGNYFCNAGEHCCANAVTRDSNCSASCDQGAGYYPVDCPGASGDGGCGAQVCCGTLAINGGTVPNCDPTQLTSSCAATCDDNPPGALSGCMGSYTIKLCTAAADCTNDSNGNNFCCNFGSPPSPVNWCVSAPLTIPGLANSCLQ